jgi:hypothetical protein
MSHSTIMEQLIIKAEHFQKQGRLQEDDLEQMIKDMKDESIFKEEGEVNSKKTASEEHRGVMEAVENGLLQVHGIALNTKQPGIVRLLGENCNGFNNRIVGNSKIAKSLNIKEELGIDCLTYCKHQLNSCHKDNKNDLKQMFQRELACTAVLAHNIHESKHAGRV